MSGTELSRMEMLPEPEQFVRLRAALAAFDADGRTITSQGHDVVDAARDVMQAWEGQKAMMRGLMAKFGGGDFASGRGAGTIVYRPHAQGTPAEGDTPHDRAG